MTIKRCLVVVGDIKKPVTYDVGFQSKTFAFLSAQKQIDLIEVFMHKLLYVLLVFCDQF